jgi:hypothetical protein
MQWRPLSFAVGVVAVALFAAQPGPAQEPSPAIKTTKPVVYSIQMTTTFVVPAGNDKIDQVRVYHALPTVRSWSAPKATFGATKLDFVPNTAKEQSHAETASRHLLWQVDGRQKPGTKLTFRSSLTVSSPNRTLDLKAVKTTWKSYAAAPKDKAAVVDLAVAKAVHPELAKVAAKFKAAAPPAQAVEAMCKWIVDTFKYDASVSFVPSDVESILKHKCGHCGHQSHLLQQLTASAGIPYRMVWGMNLYAPDGRTSDLQKVRADYTNIHTWAEVYLPGVGWVELDPGLGAKAFSVPDHLIQNNRWFQNYAVWMREGGVDKQPTWTAVPGGFQSDYGVENIISYTKK